MLIIVDKRIPPEAKEKLAAYGSIVELETKGIVYPAISGHPDIFFCKTPELLIVSPNLPTNYLTLLTEQNIKFIPGTVSSIFHPPSSILQFPATISYNAAINDHFLIHRLEYTDPVILENCSTLKKIPVKQGYTRCNLVLLKEDHYITSDLGIHKNLERNGLKGILVSPEGILLSGFKNGFIGGTMGLFDNMIFILGSLVHYHEGEIVRSFLQSLDYQIIELYDGKLVDGGSIVFS